MTHPTPGGDPAAYRPAPENPTDQFRAIPADASPGRYQQSPYQGGEPNQENQQPPYRGQYQQDQYQQDQYQEERYQQDRYRPDQYQQTQYQQERYQQDQYPQDRYQGSRDEDVIEQRSRPVAAPARRRLPWGWLALVAVLLVAAAGAGGYYAGHVQGKKDGRATAPKHFLSHAAVESYIVQQYKATNVQCYGGQNVPLTANSAFSCTAAGASFVVVVKDPDTGSYQVIKTS